MDGEKGSDIFSRENKHMFARKLLSFTCANTGISQNPYHNQTVLIIVGKKRLDKRPAFSPVI